MEPAASCRAAARRRAVLISRLLDKLAGWCAAWWVADFELDSGAWALSLQFNRRTSCRQRSCNEGAAIGQPSAP